MVLGKGDNCYFTENGKVEYGRISGKRENTYFIQMVGRCGTIQLQEGELYETEEEAKAALDAQRPVVNYPHALLAQ